MNTIFAEKTLDALRLCNLKLEPDSPLPLVWIHDYHLMVAANAIRQAAEAENLRCKIGFFLHIPFPPWVLILLINTKYTLVRGV